MTKPVYTVDDKRVGHIDGLENEQFIVKDRIIHARYYRLDRELLEEYQDGKVKLKITEQELIPGLEGPSRIFRPMNVVPAANLTFVLGYESFLLMYALNMK